MQADESVLSRCLFFSANRLSNILRRKAEKVFQDLGIGVPHVYLLILVHQYNGITQAELGDKLDIAPSTCTRFVDKLIGQGVLRKEYDWKTAHVFITDKGEAICQEIDGKLCELRQSCCDLVGEERVDGLTREIWDACEMISHKV